VEVTEAMTDQILLNKEIKFLILSLGNIMKNKKWFKVYAHYRTDVEPEEYDVLAISKAEAKKCFQNKFSWLKVFNVKEMDGQPNKEVWLYNIL
jgi:hypothetical protein